MSLTDEQRKAMLDQTRGAAYAFVEDMDHIRKIIAEEGASTGDIRRLSVVLRRLIVERDIATVAAPRMGKIMLRAPDNNPVYVHARKHPPTFFASGRARVFGWSAMIYATEYRGPFDRDAMAKTARPPGYDNEKTIDLRLDGFLSQNVICLRGVWISRKSVIKYVAHVASGAHSGTPKEADELMLAQISRSTHVRLKEDKTIHIDFFADGVDSQETAFKPLAKDSIDPVLIELLAAATFLSQSPDAIELERGIREELGLKPAAVIAENIAKASASGSSAS